LQGDYDCNAFGFYRRWKVPAAANFQINPQALVDSHYWQQEVKSVHRLMEAQKNNFQESFQLLMQEIQMLRAERAGQQQQQQQLPPVISEAPAPTENDIDLNEPSGSSGVRRSAVKRSKQGTVPRNAKKGKGHLKASGTLTPIRSTRSTQQQQESSESENESTSSYSTAQSNISGGSTAAATTSQKSGPFTFEVGDGEDICYVRELVLNLCSDPIDQFRQTNTADECVFDYLRFQGNKQH